jgi:hypothetical protein
MTRGEGDANWNKGVSGQVSSAAGLRLALRHDSPIKNATPGRVRTPRAPTAVAGWWQLLLASCACARTLSSMHRDNLQTNNTPACTHVALSPLPTARFVAHRAHPPLPPPPPPLLATTPFPHFLRALLSPFLRAHASMRLYVQSAQKSPRGLMDKVHNNEGRCAKRGTSVGGRRPAKWPARPSGQPDKVEAQVTAFWRRARETEGGKRALFGHDGRPSIKGRGPGLSLKKRNRVGICRRHGDSTQDAVAAAEIWTRKSTR